MAAVYEEQLGSPEDAIAAYKEVLALDDDQPGRARRARRALHAPEMWADLAENLESQLRSRRPTRRSSSSCSASRRCARREMEQVERSDRGLPLRCSSAIRTNAQGARRARAAGPSRAARARHRRDPRAALPAGGRLPEAHRRARSAGPPVDRRRRARSSSSTRSRSSTRTPRGDLNAAFDTLRARAARRSGERGHAAGGSIASRARPVASPISRRSSRSSPPTQDDAAARQRALHDERARLRDTTLRDIETRDRALPPGPRHRSASTSPPPSRSKRSSAAPSATRISRRSSSARPRSSTTPRTRRTRSSRPPQIEEDVLEQPEAAIGVYLKVLESTRKTCARRRARQALPRALALGGSARRLHRRRPTSSPMPRRRSASTTRSARSTSASSATSTRRSTPTSGSSSSTRTISPALGRLDVLYQTAQNWQELLSVLTHEAELCEDPNEAISLPVPDRRALREAPRGRVRAIELYREILARRADPRADAAGPRRLEERREGSARRRVGSRAGLRGHGRVAEAHQRARGAGRASRTIRSTKVDLLHRVARLHEESLRDPRRGVRHVRARARGSTTATRRRFGSSSAWRWSCKRWPQVAKLYDAELDKLADEPERFVELGLRTAQIYEVQLEDVDNAVARYRRVLERRPREPERGPLARSPVHRRPSAGAISPQILAREAEIGQTPDEILEFKYRLGQVHAAAARRPRLRRSRRTARSSARRPSTQPTLEALEGLFAAGTKQVEIAEILEPLYQAAGEWEKLAARLRGAARARSTDAERAPGDVLPHRGARRGEAPRRAGARSASTSARSRKFPLDEKSGEEVERLAGSIDGGWEKLANAYADVSACTTTRTSSASIGGRLARDVRGRARRHHQGRGDLPLRARRRSRSTPRRSPTSIASTPRSSSGPSSRRMLEQRVKATDRADELVELYARLGEVYEEQLGAGRRRDPRLPPDLRRARQDARGAIQALARIYEQKQAWTDLNTVYERELENAVGRRRRRPRSAPRSRTSRRERLEQSRRAPSRPGSACSISAARIPRRSARSPTSTSSGSSGPSSCDVLERALRHRRLDDELASRCSPPRAHLRRAARPRRRTRSTTATASSTSTTRTSHALRAIAAIWRAAARSATSSSRRSTRWWTAPRRCSTPTSSRRSSASSARPTASGSGSRTTRPTRGASCSRSIRRLRGDGRARGHLPRPRSSGPRSSTSRCSAPPRCEERRREDPRVLAGRRASGSNEVHDKDDGTHGVREDPRHRRRRTTRRSSSSRSSTPRRRAGSRSSSSTSARLETREETRERDRHPPPHRAGLRGEARRQGPGVRRARQRASARTSRIARRAKYLERMAQATGRWGELIQTANTWLAGARRSRTRRSASASASPSGTARTSGTPSTRSRTTRRSSRSIRTTSPVLRQMGSLYRKNGQLAAARADAHARARRRRRRRRSQGDPDRPRRAARAPDERGRSGRSATTSARSRSIRSTCPALEALERIYTDARPEPRARRHPRRARSRRSREPEQIAAHKLRIGGALREQRSASPSKAAQVYREVLEVDARTSLAHARPRARLRRASQQWPELVERARDAARRRHHASASASTC